jgi:hypothetical protein
MEVAMASRNSRRKPSAPHSADDELLHLGTIAVKIESEIDQLEAALSWSTKDDAKHDALIERYDDMFERIVSLPAATFAGMRVKAERVAYYNKGLGPDAPPSDPDARLTASLVDDILRA